MSWGTVRTLPLAWGTQLVLIVGVTAADVAADEKRDAVAGGVRLIVWYGVHVAACVERAFCAFWRPAGGGCGEVCRVGRGARCDLCLECSLCFLSAWRWQGWFSSSRGMVWTLRLVFGVHLVLFVGVAAADVVLDVVVAAALRVFPRDGLRGPKRLASGASWPRSEWGPLAGLGM